MEPLFLDTWAFVAHFNADETAKVRWLFEIEAGKGRPLITSWQVITETVGWSCGSRAPVEFRDSMKVAGFLKTWIEDGFFELLHCTPEQMTQALELRVRRPSIAKLSLVDCTTAVLCAASGVQWVVSGDEHLPALGHGLSLCPHGPPPS